VGERLPIVNGIYAEGSLEAQRLAKMADEGGASALLVFPPAIYTMGQRPEMAIEHVKRIADVTDLPLIRFSVQPGGWTGLPPFYPVAHGRGGAHHCRHQGLVRQCATGRPSDSGPACPPATGQRAQHAQRLAV